MSPRPSDRRAAATRRLVGRYRLDSELGRGAMGTVWSAYDEVLHRPVAVKEVRLSLVPVGERAVVRERTLREARATAMLSHPNVVTLYDVVEVDAEPYVVMELLPSRSLASYIAERGTLSPSETAEIGSAVASALMTAHRAGITHRDVKPGNVLIGSDGQIKLTDFGIARNAAESSMTQTGTVLGSPPYIAPEVAMGRAVGPPADLWGLGATLYACLEGRPPYDAGDPVSTVSAVVHGDVPRPRGHGPVQDVVRGLMVKDPTLRMPLLAVRRRLRPLMADPEGPALSAAPAPATTEFRRPDQAPDPSDHSGLIPVSRGRSGTLVEGAQPPGPPARTTRLGGPTPPTDPPDDVAGAPSPDDAGDGRGPDEAVDGPGSTAPDVAGAESTEGSEGTEGTEGAAPADPGDDTAPGAADGSPGDAGRAVPDDAGPSPAPGVSDEVSGAGRASGPADTSATGASGTGVTSADGKGPGGAAVAAGVAGVVATGAAGAAAGARADGPPAAAGSTTGDTVGEGEQAGGARADDGASGGARADDGASGGAPADDGTSSGPPEDDGTSSGPPEDDGSAGGDGRADTAGEDVGPATPDGDHGPGVTSAGETDTAEPAGRPEGAVETTDPAEPGDESARAEPTEAAGRGDEPARPVRDDTADEPGGTGDDPGRPETPDAPGTTAGAGETPSPEAVTPRPDGDAPVAATATDEPSAGDASAPAGGAGPAAEGGDTAAQGGDAADPAGAGPAPPAAPAGPRVTTPSSGTRVPTSSGTPSVPRPSAAETTMVTPRVAPEGPGARPPGPRPPVGPTTPGPWPGPPQRPPRGPAPAGPRRPGAQALAADPGPLPFTPSRPSGPSATERRRRRILVLALIVVLALAGLVAGYAATRLIGGQAPFSVSLAPDGPVVDGELLVSHADDDARYSGTGMGFTALVPAGWQQFRLQEPGGDIAVRYVSEDAEREVRFDRLTGYYPARRAAGFTQLVADPKEIGADAVRVEPLTVVAPPRAGATEPVQQTVYRATTGTTDDRTTWTRLIPVASDLWIVRLTAPSRAPGGSAAQFAAIADSFTPPST